MGDTTAFLGFAAAFLAFAAAAAGIALVAAGALPPAQRRAARPALTAGLVLVAASAAVAGAGPRGWAAHGDGAALVAGGVLVAAGALAGWRPAAAAGFVAGGAAVAVAGALALSGARGVPVDAAALAGGAALAAAVVGAARGSVAARVAAASGASLVVVVLALSGVLSVLSSSSLRQDRVRQLSAAATAGAAQVGGLAGTAVMAASSLTAALDVRLAGTPPGGLAAAVRSFGVLAGGGAGELVGFLPAAGGPAGPDPAIAAATSGVRVVVAAACGRGASGELTPLPAPGPPLAAVAAEAVCSARGAPCAACRAGRLGTVVVALPVGRPQLERLLGGRRDGWVAVTAGGRVLASSDRAGPAATAAGRAGPGVLVASDPIGAATTGGALRLVVAEPATGLAGERDALLRDFFLVAAGGAVLAMGLAVLTGDRITARLRRLTVAATRVAAGGPPRPVGGDTEGDEIGALAGAFDAMVGAVEDKSAEQRAAAESEARLRARLQAVVDGMGDALVATDRLGVVTDFNHAAEQLTGLDAGQVVGRPLGEALGLAAELPAGEPATSELDLPGAPPVPVLCTTGRLVGPIGEDAGAVLVLRDLRRERELERMKSELLSRVGHELRTPLTGILGYTDLLLGRALSPEQSRSFHERIRAAAERQLRVVELLEWLAAAGAGRLAVRSEPLDVRSILRDATPAWEERLGAQRPLTVRVARRLPPVPGDSRWLRTALDELVDNAAKFSPEGGAVTVRAEDAGDAELPAVRVTVADHGIGMDEDEQRAAVGDFAQADASDTRAFGGLGLGLTLAIRVAEAHGGRLDVRSAPGKGTSVSVVLPAQPARAVTQTAGAARLR